MIGNGHGNCVENVCICEYFYTPADACETSYMTTWGPSMVALPTVHYKSLIFMIAYFEVILVFYIALFLAQIFDAVLDYRRNRFNKREIKKPLFLCKICCLIFSIVYLLRLGWWMTNLTNGSNEVSS